MHWGTEPAIGGKSRMGSPPSSQKSSAASPLRRTQSDLQSVQELETEKLGGQP